MTAARVVARTLERTAVLNVLEKRETIYESCRSCLRAKLREAACVPNVRVFEKLKARNSKRYIGFGSSATSVVGKASVKRVRRLLLRPASVLCKLRLAKSECCVHASILTIPKC